MNGMKYVYGPVPSRRLGISLGVSPIPKKTCNHSCIYCQLGPTASTTNTRQMYCDVEDIIKELKQIIKANITFDVITIVGEGEPTLYLGLENLIYKIKKQIDKPVAVITNGALLYDQEVQSALSASEIVLPSLDAYDDISYKRINRPYKELEFKDMYRGLKEFSKNYKGQLWIEIMLMKNINDDNESLNRYAKTLSEVKYDKLYLNTPVRPPAEKKVTTISHGKMNFAVDFLGGISIELLQSKGFHSEITDDYEAVLSIIRRHPMNQFEIEGFLKSRGSRDTPKILNAMKSDDKMNIINYKGYDTYRLK